MSDEKNTIVIIRRGKKAKHGYHGGAWKVAYADFVTAMMAFFLVMWILSAGSREQKAAIAAYFNNPSMTMGKSTMAPSGRMGPGGASTSPIKLGGARDLSHGAQMDHRQGLTSQNTNAHRMVDISQADKIAQAHEKERLEELMKQLNAAIEKSQALAPFKDQLLLDITPDGLRIQIVDKQNRPMFDLGSAQLKPYTRDILHVLASFINRVPNRITLSGHTDDAPYSNDKHYGNWELSSDRANAARRELLVGGLADAKVARVIGLADAVPLDKGNPRNPINRRISIIVMTKQAEAAALDQDVAQNERVDQHLPQNGVSNAMTGQGLQVVPSTAPTPRGLDVQGLVTPLHADAGTPLPR